MAAVVGALRVVLGIDTAQFITGTTEAQRALGSIGTSFNRMGQKWTAAGKGLTAGVTVPVTGLGIAALKMAGDFEASMGKVAISTGAAGVEMDRMTALATKLGSDSVFGASEVADAMDALAKNGLSATTILEGAAKAAVDLAAAAGSDLAPATNAITDVMQQFKLTAADLPMAVNQITGAVNQSKLDFSDFTGAIAQAGGVAANVGVSFQDFNATIAATSSLFNSGSDAGTSFKTFLTTLVPKSKPARVAMEEYGLAFFDAAGRMKSMSDIAEMLQVKLGKLSDQKLNDVMSTIFGTDAMRTAIGLMQQGAAGIDSVKGKIAETDAAAQAAQRMTGLNAQMEQLGGAFESLAIAIGKTGVLDMVSSFVKRLADFVSNIATAHPGLVKFAVGFAAVSAAMGPVMLAIGVLATTVLPFFLARLSPIGLAIAALINPLGTAIGLLGRFVAQMGGMAILRTIAPMFLRFLGPVGLAITAFQLFGDKIIPVLRDLGDQIVKSLGPAVSRIFSALSDALGTLGSAFTSIASGPLKPLIDLVGDLLAGLLSLAGQSVIMIITSLAEVIGTAMRVIADALKIVVSLLTGDWSGAWNATKALVTNAVAGIGRAVEALAPGAIAAMRALYTGVKTWLQDKLGGVFDWVATKVEWVANKFKWLDDVVVRHSYIPDMVDSIGEHMRRLNAEMVAPAGAAADATAEKFEGLKSLMDRLFPEHVDAIKFASEMAELDRGLSIGKLSADAYAESVKRLRAEYGAPIAENRGLIDAAFDGLTDKYPEIKAANDNLKVSFEDTLQGISSAFQSFASGVQSGGFLNILGGILSAVTQLAGVGVFGKSIQGNVTKVEARATGGPVVGGRPYLVGERGMEVFTPQQSGWITPNHAIGGGTARVEIVEAPAFATRVVGISDGVSVQRISAAQRTSARSGRQRLA